MADVTVKRISEMDSTYGGAFVRARASLGVASFGMQIVNLPPHSDKYPEHDEQESGQEEVYTLLRGSADLVVGDERVHLEPGIFARVGKSEKRTVVPGADGAQVLVLGGTPGQPYDPPSWSEVGAEM